MENIKNWLEWANTYKNVKVVIEKIPDGILPDGYTGRLHDVKVATNNRMDDDSIYENDELLRERVARGNCVLELQKNDCITYSLVVRGLRKFSDVTGKLFIRPLNEAKTIICTQKMNGEAAHLGVCKIDSEYYICGGSKNVHMLFRNDQDLSKYDLKSKRFTFAIEICRRIISSLLINKSLFDFIIRNNMTAVFEYLDSNHQHVEDLSYLDNSILKFITWISCDLNNDSLCRFPSDSSINIARCFDLDTIKYEVIGIKDLSSHVNNVRTIHGIEGEVLYFLDEKSRTIGITKIKTKWYIILRAIREKIRSALTRKWNIERFKREIGNRMKELQEWLEFEDETRLKWMTLALDFYKWSFGRSIMMNKFPTLWNRFLQETNNDYFT